MLKGEIPFLDASDILSGKKYFGEKEKLSAPVMNLIYSCLEPCQEKRIKMNDIINHEWFNE